MESWVAFQREFCDAGGGWRLEGYELMEAVEEWAADRDDVRVVECSDGLFTSALLVLLRARLGGPVLLMLLLRQLGSPTFIWLPAGEDSRALELAEALQQVGRQTGRPA